MPTREEFKQLLKEIDLCKDPKQLRSLLIQYDRMTLDLRAQEPHTPNSCPECGNPETVHYPEGGDNCFRCFDCGVQFWKRDG